MIQRRKKHFTKQFYWGTSEELQYISHGKQNYTARHYKTIRLAKKLDILETLANQYANPALRDVIGNLNSFQPNPNYACTMAIISPFTSRLELITIPCDEAYNISTIICQKFQSSENKVCLHQLSRNYILFTILKCAFNGKLQIT